MRRNLSGFSGWTFRKAGRVRRLRRLTHARDDSVALDRDGERIPIRALWTVDQPVMQARRLSRRQLEAERLFIETEQPVVFSEDAAVEGRLAVGIEAMQRRRLERS